MISSLSNPQMKHITQLMKKSKYRSEQQCFVAEGIKMVMETPDHLLDMIYLSESFSPEQDTKHWLEGKKYQVVSDKVFKDITDTMTPQGIIAVVKMREYSLDQLLDGSHFILLETLQDPGNLGTILRTAEGAGVDCVILNRTCVDIYNPKVVRSTMGSLYRVPFIYVDDFAKSINKMKMLGIRLFAAHLKGEKYYYEADFSGKCGFIIGNEANGLTDETAKLASEYIKIPMSGHVESLNAAMAAGILMYEAKRQKSTRKLK